MAGPHCEYELLTFILAHSSPTSLGLRFIKKNGQAPEWKKREIGTRDSVSSPPQSTPCEKIPYMRFIKLVEK